MNPLQKNFDTLIFICLIIVSGLAAIALGQDTNFDFKNYHFYNPYAFLTNRFFFDLSPANLQGYNNPLVDIPAFYFIQYCSPKFVGFALGAIQGMNAFLLYKIGLKIFHRPWLSLVSAIVSYGGAINISELGTTMNDTIVSIFILLGVLLSLQKEKNKYFIIGILVGVSAGLKLSASIYMIGLLGALLFASGIRLKSKVLNTVKMILSLCTGLLISHGYWSYFLEKNFASPIFPYFNEYFHSNYMFGFLNLYNRFFISDFMHGFFLPIYIVMQPTLVAELFFRDLRLLICFALVIIFLAHIFFRHATHKKSLKLPSNDAFILLFCICSYLAWLTQPIVYRHLMVIEFLSPIFIYIILNFLLRNKKVLIALFLSLLLIFVITTKPFHWGRTNWSQTYFDQKMPEVKNLHNAIVFISIFDPLSYVIPLFPQTTRFIRLSNYLYLSPEMPSGLRDKIFDYLKEAKNSRTPLYLLHRKKIQEILPYFTSEFYLQYFGLKYEKANCLPWSTKMDDDLLLCPLSFE